MSRGRPALRYGVRLERVEADADGVTGVLLANGERLHAADMVVASDLPAAYAGLLPPRARDWRLQRRRPRFAPSCLLLQLGLPRRLEGRCITPRTSAASGATASTRSRAGRAAAGPEPNLPVTYPGGADPQAVPPGHATLSVLEPTANLQDGHEWGRRTVWLRRHLPARLTALGYGDLERDRAVEVLVDPSAWAA